tara:strand:+ start:910 stop:1560 length:651 start_codon:yes stop_codon:yes gene_type:complete
MTNQVNIQNDFANDYLKACVKPEQALAKRVTKAIGENPAMIREIAQAVHYALNDCRVYDEKKKDYKVDGKLKKELFANSPVGDLSYLLDRTCRNDLGGFKKIGEKSAAWSEGFIVDVCQFTEAKGVHGLIQAANKFHKSIEKDFLKDAPIASDETASDETASDETASDAPTKPSLADIAAKLIEQLGKKEAYALSILLGDLSQDGLTDAELEKAIG